MLADTGKTFQNASFLPHLFCFLMQVDLFRNLVSIDPSRKEATFEHVNDTNTPKQEETIPYSFIHVCPPMGK